MTISAPDFFSDSELGPRPLVLEELPAAAWTGIAATFHRFLDQEYFAGEFPEQCQDGHGVVGTSRAGLRALLVSTVPRLGDWPREDGQPDTATAMDLVGFGWHYGQEPSVSSQHGFYRHAHYSFSRHAGRRNWQAEINRILARNGVALRQEDDGRVVRVGTVASGLVWRSGIPLTGDGPLDEKIAIAVHKFQSPDLQVRREALEALWDAFERIKTVVHPSDKKRSSEALIARMVELPASQRSMSEEFKALTDIGNSYQIRHHEVRRDEVETSMVDLLFVRALAVVEAAARALDQSTLSTPDLV